MVLPTGRPATGRTPGPRPVGGSEAAGLAAAAPEPHVAAINVTDYSMIMMIMIQSPALDSDSPAVSGGPPGRRGQRPGPGLAGPGGGTVRLRSQ